MVKSDGPSQRPATVANAPAFFDFRPVYGDASLADDLRTYLDSALTDRKTFLERLAERAVRNAPPMGFFRSFVVEKGGDVIPKVSARVPGARVPGARRFVLPRRCPVCGSTIDRPADGKSWSLFTLSFLKVGDLAGVLPPSLGGLGLNWRDRSVVLEEIGRSFLGGGALNCAPPDQPNTSRLKPSASPMPSQMAGDNTTFSARSDK